MILTNSRTKILLYVFITLFTINELATLKENLLPERVLELGFLAQRDCVLSIALSPQERVEV